MRRPDLLLSLLVLLVPHSVAAQFVARPGLDWRTTETPHFSVHYPAQYTEWARAVATRLESARTAVGGIVGFVPASPVQVLIDDPVNAPNGFALPFLDRPTMVFFPVPPTPRQSIGNTRDWGEMLAVHEFAHLAHLTRPSRNPRSQFLWRLSPAQLGPIARASPRWVIEGFATYVEGRITGSGRPYNAWRPAILRQWALEGRMPTYAQLSGTGGYQGGGFAYLGGSAYLDWLAAREGDSTIAHLWRRLTARTPRSFPQAFAGVYGRTPDVLYGRFVAELTASAFAVERQVASLGGVVAGTLVQHLTWDVGDPALSPDGSRVAVALRHPTRPQRIVVWRTGPDSIPPRVRAARDSARARARRRDPDDVPAREFFPPPKQTVAVLEPRDGRAFDAPRFMPDGVSLLVTRAEPIGQGAFRPDLYVWNSRTRALRRVTRRAGVRQADPTPDAKGAVAVQCTRGWCDLVRVDLARGSVTTLRAGSPTVSYYRPRVSPSGRHVAVAEQRDDRWRIAVLDLDAPDGPRRYESPADANRYDADWANDSTLVAVSERGGIANLERIPLGRGAAETITRVTGAAMAPDVDRTGAIWYLTLHARGNDVHRMTADAPAVSLPVLDTALAPAVPTRPAVPPPSLAQAPLARERPYGIGPRATRWLPGVTRDAGATSAQLLIVNGDPVGRLEAAVLGAFGDAAAPQGARTWVTVRRWSPAFTAEAFFSRQRPDPIGGAVPQSAHADLAGMAVRSDAAVTSSRWNGQLMGGVSGMRVDGAAAANGEAIRGAAWLSVGGSAARTVRSVPVSIAARLSGDLGQHGDAPVRHLTAVVAGGVKLPFAPFVQVTALRAHNGSGLGAPFERVTVGGAPSALIDPVITPQRLAMPALPVATLQGRNATVARSDVRLGMLHPYVWVAQVDDDVHDGWHRVVGAELRFATAAVPLVTLPRLDLSAGVAHSMDEPYRRRTTLYLGTAYRP